MKGNKILTQDDKEKLANFLFQYLRYGGDRKKIVDQAKVWFTKDGEVSIKDSIVTLNKRKCKELDEVLLYYCTLEFLSLAILFGLVASKIKGENAVIAMGTLAGLAAVAFLASVGYLINQYVGDKKYANAYAEEMVDAYNVKCYEELKNVVQDQYDLINEILDNKEYAKIYPELPRSDDQMTQFVINAPLKSNDSVVIYK